MRSFRLDYGRLTIGDSISRLEEQRSILGHVIYQITKGRIWCSGKHLCELEAELKQTIDEIYEKRKLLEQEDVVELNEVFID